MVRDGALLYERYGGEMDETSLHLSQSVGKSVVGLTAGIVGVDPAALVTDFVPEVRGSGYDGRDRPAPAGHDRGDRLRRGLRGVRGLRRRLRVAPADHRQSGHGARVPGDDRAGRLVTRRTLALRHAEHGPARARRGARGGHAVGAGDQRGLWAPLGAERDAELTVDAGGHGHDRRRLLRHAARLRAARRAGRRRRSRHRPARLDRCARRGARSRRRRRSSTPRATPTSGGSATGGVTARGIHGQCIAVDPSGTVVAILSSWPEAVDERRDDVQRALIARITA